MLLVYVTGVYKFVIRSSPGRLGDWFSPATYNLPPSQQFNPLEPTTLGVYAHHGFYRIDAMDG